jgi:hypothetical protein
MKPRFRDVLADLSTKSEHPVTCVIADGIMSFAIDIAKELGISAMTFWPCSSCHLWSFLCLPKLIEEGQLPVGGEGKCVTLTYVNFLYIDLQQV